jgi:quercetin dioxygenase-like cupin family protein
MTWTPRRIVTGHDPNGTSVFVADGPPPVIREAPDGATFVEIWNTTAMPAPIAAAEPDPTEVSLIVPPGPNGTKIRVNVLPPGVVSPMHRTETVDYGIVLEGEVTLVLSDSETTVRTGDVVVQRGTDHRWENRSAAVTRIAFILVDGAFTDDLETSLGAAAHTLLNGPIHP